MQKPIFIYKKDRYFGGGGKLLERANIPLLCRGYLKCWCVNVLFYKEFIKILFLKKSVYYMMHLIQIVSLTQCFFYITHLYHTCM